MSDTTDLKAEVLMLRKENAELRELMYERAHVYAIQNMTEDELRITAANVMEDNAKLRELLTFYLGCLTKGHVNCDSCAFAEGVCEHGRKVIDWARKLGVEVD